MEARLVTKGHMDKHFVVIDSLINLFWNWIFHASAYKVNVNNNEYYKIRIGISLRGLYGRGRFLDFINLLKKKSSVESYRKNIHTSKLKYILFTEW